MFSEGAEVMEDPSSDVHEAGEDEEEGQAARESKVKREEEEVSQCYLQPVWNILCIKTVAHPPSEARDDTRPPAVRRRWPSEWLGGSTHVTSVTRLTPLNHNLAIISS